MGTITRDIAKIGEPMEVSLSGNPNFITFQNKGGQPIKYKGLIKINASQKTAVERTFLRITNTAGENKEFKGTLKPEEVGAGIFYISDDKEETAENLKYALLLDDWINANFNIQTVKQNIEIQSKGEGKEYNLEINAPYNIGDSAYSINTVSISKKYDSISGENSTAEIEVEVFKNDKARLGGLNPNQVPEDLIGVLNKTYSGDLLWFNLNAVFSQFFNFNEPPKEGGWFNPGTLSTFKINGILKGYNNFRFYQSDYLYTIAGGSLDGSSLESKIYMGFDFKLLSNRPKTRIIKGFKCFLNFILADDQSDLDYPIDFKLKINYKAYTTAGDFLGNIYTSEKPRAELNNINSYVLNFDEILEAYPNAGEIRTCLMRGSAQISSDLVFEVLPEHLHILNYFYFLNDLGGWDSFNFNNSAAEEIKTNANTYNITGTPSRRKADGIAYSVELDKEYILESGPIWEDVAQWLEELAVSRAVFDQKGRRVNITEFELKKDPKNKDFQNLKIKYKLA